MGVSLHLSSKRCGTSMTTTICYFPPRNQEPPASRTPYRGTRSGDSTPPPASHFTEATACAGRAQLTGTRRASRSLQSAPHGPASPSTPTCLLTFLERKGEGARE